MALNRPTCMTSLAALLVALAPMAARAEAVGTAGAANTRSSGTPPGGAVKLIEIGAQIVRNEKIETSVSGSVQIVFIDKTTLNVGPNSTLVIDRFVFNPATSTGEVALSLGRGVMRIVGGQATHTGGATVTTPVATIGIRGGIATISHCPVGGAPIAKRGRGAPPVIACCPSDGAIAAAAGNDTTGANEPRCRPVGTLAINHFGLMDVTAGGSTQNIFRPGFGVSIGAPGAQPSTPVRVSQALVNQMNASLTSKGGQTGGSKSIPTPSIAAANGLGATDSGLDPTTTISRQAQTVTSSATASTALATSTLVSNVAKQSVTQGVTQTAAVVTANQISPPPPPPPPPPLPPPPPPAPPPPPPPVAGPPPAAYVMMTTAGAGSAAPFLTASFLTSGTAVVSPVYGFRGGGLNNGQPNFASRNFQTNLAINGTGAGQTSTLSVMTSVVAQLPQGFLLGGAFQAANRSQSTAFAGASFGAVSSTTNPAATVATVPTDGQGLPTGSFPISQNRLVFDSSTGQVVASTASATQVGTGSYAFDQTVSPAAVPPGLGANRPVRTGQGFVGGIGQTLKFNSSMSQLGPAYIVTNPAGTFGDVSITLFGASRVAAQFNVINPLATGATDEFRTASFQFGEPTGTGTTSYDASRGAYVDLTHFAALSQRIFKGVNNGFTETSTINGNVLGTNEKSGTMLVTSTAVNAASFFPGVTFCQCDYTQWGLWSMETVRQDTANNVTLNDRTGIAFWVAGLPSQVSDVNSAVANNTVATYSGHVIASIANGPNNPALGQFPSQYIAASNFTNTVNFGSRNGVVSVPNLDGSSYGGTVSLTPNANFFVGALNTGPNGNRGMVVSGSFFRGSASPIGEMGGAVNIIGTNYLGSGIFAARKP
ncbi:MAG: FecR domain-containing protein [Methylobacteriaceae bacterium]|nr:FecR domain-containing protein [Methylobacteriaceae bacterium]